MLDRIARQPQTVLQNSRGFQEPVLPASNRQRLLESPRQGESFAKGWYFRSDHLPYARLNVPAVMFTSNLHPQYHTPKDDPESIDCAKLTRMTQWLYLTGWHIAQADQRPTVIPGFRLER